MARNVEIKARVKDLDALQAHVSRLASEGPFDIAQDDTFFGCATGRLKLRAFADGRGELIFYRRDDAAGPKESFYLRSPVSDPPSLREALAQAYGVVGRVVKQRTLYLIGRTRVHLDRVHGLGCYLELEVVLREGESAADGVLEAHALKSRLGVANEDLVEHAYVDLLTGPAAR